MSTEHSCELGAWSTAQGNSSLRHLKTTTTASRESKAHESTAAEGKPARAGDKTSEGGPEQRRARQMQRNSPQRPHRARHIAHVASRQIAVVHVQHPQPASVSGLGFRLMGLWFRQCLRCMSRHPQPECHPYCTLQFRRLAARLPALAQRRRPSPGARAWCIWWDVVRCGGVAQTRLCPQHPPISLCTPHPPRLSTCATRRANHNAPGLQQPPRATHQQRR